MKMSIWRLAAFMMTMVDRAMLRNGQDNGEESGQKGDI